MKTGRISLDSEPTVIQKFDMAIFATKDELYAVLPRFFQHLADNDHIGPKLQASRLKIRFVYKEPDSCIYIDLSNDVPRIVPDDYTAQSDIEMTMRADIAHKFWKGEVNLVTALARREITAKGPIPKILKLLPIIKPAYSLYKPFLEANHFNLD